MNKERWNARYREESYAYGQEPNVFFKQWLPQFEPKTILMPADGEGRNGVYAATLGWQVTSFDLSSEGRAKALQLANRKQVDLKYLVGDFADIQFEAAAFDAIGLIYAHFPTAKKSEFHLKLHNYLKPGGVVIFEAFSKHHLPYQQANPSVGGPPNMDVTFSMAEIEAYFPNYDTLLLQEEVVNLAEGKYHIGQGSVVRFVGRKSS
ncbi:MAG: class I SAM-dependent methyltransferase [Saprospiraceae bacterium]|nr:class I SAM-dependent methyltransferase [Saprospiraceae bacterium]